MKHIAIIPSLLLATLSGTYAADVVIKTQPKSDASGLYLQLVGNQTKVFSPSNDLDAQFSGVAKWARIPPGKYRVIDNPGFSDWDGHRIVISDISVGKGSNSINVAIPRGELDIVVNYRGVPFPRKATLTYGIFLRVDRVGKDGRLDRDYRQWLHTDIKDGINKGYINHLAPGSYRITAFHNDVYPLFGDVGYGILEVTAESLKAGRAILDIDKPVEQPGAGQSGTKPADKVPAEDQPTPPTSKNGPR